MSVRDNGSLRELAKVTNPLLRKRFGQLLPRLVEAIEAEIKRGEEKWGDTDTSPSILLNAALEELGEAAHAINHDEGKEKAQQEIIEVMGVLVRLYWMVNDYPLGVKGIRDPDAPCERFDPRESQLVDVADCETDGHYLCDECAFKAK